MKNGGLVSVVIPTFNRAYCLERTIRSVLDQTYKNLEVILVDDGSTDETRILVQRLALEDNRVKYFYKFNGGVANARNFGFTKIQGDYMALLDSDDIWFPWKLEVQVECLEKTGAGMIWTDMNAIDDIGSIQHYRYLREMYTSWARWDPEQLFFTHDEVCVPNVPKYKIVDLWAGEIFSEMIMGSIVHTSTTLLTRERLDKVGNFNENFRYSGEDFDFHLRTCKAGPVAFLDTPSIYYRIGGADQLSHPEYMIYTSRNFLDTILPYIQNERGSIYLSDDMINEVLAETYRWIGNSELYYGSNVEAIKNLLISLKYQPWQPRLFLMLLTALIGKDAGKSMRSFYTRVRQAF